MNAEILSLLGLSLEGYNFLMALSGLFCGFVLFFFISIVVARL